MSSSPTIKSRPWWLGPGPLAIAGVTLAACGAVVWQGVREARQPVDVRDRNAQLIRTGSFCDAPPPSAGAATPGTGK